MPFVQVQMIEGKTDEQKRQLIAGLTETIATVLGIHHDGVRVILYDIPSSHYGIGGVPIRERVKQALPL